jgi:hypothetical protein
MWWNRNTVTFALCIYQAMPLNDHFTTATRLQQQTISMAERCLSWYGLGLRNVATELPIGVQFKRKCQCFLSRSFFQRSDTLRVKSSRWFRSRLPFKNHGKRVFVLVAFPGERHRFSANPTLLWLALTGPLSIATLNTIEYGIKIWRPSRLTPILMQRQW